VREEDPTRNIDGVFSVQHMSLGCICLYLNCIVWSLLLLWCLTDHICCDHRDRKLLGLVVLMWRDCAVVAARLCCCC
jgi:hypothetical protein